MRDTIDTIDARIAAKAPSPLSEGIIHSVLPHAVYVRIKGTSQVVLASYDLSANPQPGSNCLLAKAGARDRYVLVTSFSESGQIATSNAIAGNAELAPPNNVRAFTAIADVIGIAWDVPPQQTVTFQVQSNATAVDAGAAEIVTTRGAYAIISSTTALYFRVRSISRDWQYSSWSAWVLATPTRRSVTVSEFSFSQATPSPLAIITLLSGNRLLRIEVDIDVAATTSAATIALGISGTPGLFLATTETDLTIAAQFVDFPGYEAISTTPLIFTITPAAQTFSGRVRLETAQL